jgi:hypothetical protein
VTHNPNLEAFSSFRLLRGSIARAAAAVTPEQKRNFRRMQFSRAVDWADRQGLIGAREIGDVTYLWLTHSKPQNDGEEV